MFRFNITGSGGEKKGQGGQRRRTRSPRPGGDQRHAVDAGDVVAEQGVVAAVGEHGGVAEHGGGEVGRRARLHQQQLPLAHTLRAAEARREQQSCGEEPHDPCGGGKGEGGGSEPAERGYGLTGSGRASGPAAGARTQPHRGVCTARCDPLQKRGRRRRSGGRGKRQCSGVSRAPTKRCFFAVPAPASPPVLPPAPRPPYTSGGGERRSGLRGARGGEGST